MSSYWAAYHGQGLALTAQEFHDFLKNYKGKCKDEKTLEQIRYVMDGEEDISEVDFIASDGSKFNIVCADDNFTNGFRLTPYVINGEPNKEWDMNEDFPRSDVYIISANKAIDGMDCFVERAYKSYEEFVGEFKNKLAQCLPEDFDWDSHIGIFSYACYT